MDYERWLLEDALDFEFDGRGYRFEPEFTQEELREIEARATEAPEAPAEAVPRTVVCLRLCRSDCPVLMSVLPSPASMLSPLCKDHMPVPFT
ncbi:unnamed protein product [Boreogadus saida]